MAAIMPIGEPRPRGTVLGERADKRRVREVEHCFRCKTCGGYLDARDLVWVEDHAAIRLHLPAELGFRQGQTTGAGAASDTRWGAKVILH